MRNTFTLVLRFCSLFCDKRYMIFIPTHLLVRSTKKIDPIQRCFFSQLFYIHSGSRLCLKRLSKVFAKYKFPINISMYGNISGVFSLCHSSYMYFTCCVDGHVIYWAVSLLFLLTIPYFCYKRSSLGKIQLLQPLSRRLPDLGAGYGHRS